MSIAEEIEKYFDLLWPLNRSLTGNDNRKSLQILSEVSEINQIEVPSGKKCFDWTVPEEYNVTEAYIKTLDGNIVIDFKSNNLHLMGYSVAIDSILNWEELDKHLHYISEMPDAIPYKTSYYVKEWGFCITYNQYLKLDRKANYKVKICSEFNGQGSMTIGERVIKGKKDQEILFSTYICHPSLANNELSGPLLTVFIQRIIEQQEDLEYTYRFLYLPETIGSIYYLSEKGENLKKSLIAGYVITCVGDRGELTFKLSRRGDTIADKAVLNVLKSKRLPYKCLSYFPTGSDERQYCSPYFNLPVASLMRSMYAQYPEYHTSLDNKSIIDFIAMEELIWLYIEIINVIEKNKTYISINPKCEPFLQNKGLYDSTGGPKAVPINTNALLWILNQADGENNLISISNKSEVPVLVLNEVSTRLLNAGLIKEIK
jgi:aminopeptidase-like protein